ncbi:hypothetical protein GQ53DRAFT_30003 [Thozetella sp. PMI_491]|nr:hypothetical protein GQ53DRAFT_30003 [Thozetella sp. PMI_491]
MATQPRSRTGEHCAATAASFERKLNAAAHGGRWEPPGCNQKARSNACLGRCAAFGGHDEHDQACWPHRTPLSKGGGKLRESRAPCCWHWAGPEPLHWERQGSANRPGRTLRETLMAPRLAGFTTGTAISTLDEPAALVQILGEAIKSTSCISCAGDANEGASVGDGGTGAGPRGRLPLPPRRWLGKRYID